MFFVRKSVVACVPCPSKNTKKTQLKKQNETISLELAETKEELLTVRAKNQALSQLFIALRKEQNDMKKQMFENSQRVTAAEALARQVINILLIFFSLSLFCGARFLFC